MKHIQFLPALLICLSAAFSLPSCSNSDTLVPSQTVIENNVHTGTWKITSFIDDGNNETNHFSGFSFTFGNSNTISATNGSITNTGSWSISDSNSSDDSIDDLAFNITFNLSNDFENLSEDWKILTQSSSRIELTHVSGGNGGTAFLTFEKS